MSVLTNATLFHRAPVQEGLLALADLDGRIWAILDAGTEPFFHLIDGTTLPLKRVLDNIDWAAQRWPITLQSMFHLWNGQPPPPEEIAAWAGRIRDLLEAGGQIAEIQIYTVARRPADDRVGPLSADQLAQIAQSVSELGIPLTVSGGV